MGRRGVGNYRNAANFFYERLVEMLEKRGFVWGLVKCYKLTIYDTKRRRHFTKIDVYLSKKNPGCDHSWTTIYKYALHNPTYPKKNSLFYFEHAEPNALRYMIIVPTDIIEEIDNEIDMRDAGTSNGYFLSDGGSLIKVTVEYNGGSSSQELTHIPEPDPLYEDIIKLMNIYC